MAKVTLAASGKSASLSDKVDLQTIGPTSGIIAIQMPTAWTAAAITFQGSPSLQDPFQDIYDQGGTEISITVDASRYVVLDQDTRSKLMGLRFIKLRSGTTGTPVNQAAERTIELVTS